MIEALTYRHMGHSRSDPATYRPAGELERVARARPDPQLRDARCERTAIVATGDIDARARERATAVAEALRARARLARARRRRPVRLRLGGGIMSETSPTARRSSARSATSSRAIREVVLIGEDVGAAGGVFKATEGLFAPLRRPAGARHADLRAGDRRHRARRRGVGAAAGRRDHVRRLRRRLLTTRSSTSSPSTATSAAARSTSRRRCGWPAAAASASARSTRSASRTGSCRRPGCKLCVPATPADAYTLLRAAIRDDDPVIVFEHKALYGVTGELGDGPGLPIGAAEIVRAGQRRDGGRHPADAPPRRRGSRERSRPRASRVEVIDPAHDRAARHGHDRRERRPHRPARVRAGGDRRPAAGASR